MIDKSRYKLNETDAFLDQDFTEEILFEIFMAHKIAMEKSLDEKDVLDIVSGKLETVMSEMERDKGSIEAIVSSIVSKAYYKPDIQNYLDIASELIIKLANKHTLFDGNKRTALITGLMVLNNGLGIHLDLDFTKEKYIDLILSVVANWKSDMSEEKQLQYVNNFLNNEVQNQK